MKNITITFKKVSEPRLTITADNGCRIKLPLDREGCDNTEIIDFFKNVINEVGDVDSTLRGHIYKNYLSLKKNSNEVVKVFSLDFVDSE
jgi:hypothetical protein